jgi:hypothetical protein
MYDRENGEDETKVYYIRDDALTKLLDDISDMNVAAVLIGLLIMAVYTIITMVGEVRSDQERSDSSLPPTTISKAGAKRQQMQHEGWGEATTRTMYRLSSSEEPSARRLAPRTYRPPL